MKRTRDKTHDNKHDKTRDGDESCAHTNCDNNMFGFIGLLTILIGLWTILYVIPSVFIMLFHTFLGNLILLLTTIFVGTFVNVRWGFIAFICLVVLYQIFHYNLSEGFQGFQGPNQGSKGSGSGENNLKWSQSTRDLFIQFNKVSFPTTQFNMNIIENQASESDVTTLMTTGYWPWSQKTQDLYKDNIAHNEIIKIDPGISLDNAMKLYNENAIKQLLAWDTKEGSFLLYGVNAGTSVGEPSFLPKSLKKHDSIKCAHDGSGMEKTSYLGSNLFNGFFNFKKEKISNENVPDAIHGFSFVNGSACNPCGPLNESPDYSCPFKINTATTESVISEIWADLW